ncbi:ATP-binding cassette domain-containing protein [Acetobacteraceae bacterium]|nr:ATP-binding cassette domain-containing protein [Acetobacteraceae bacterium]
MTHSTTALRGAVEQKTVLEVRHLSHWFNSQAALNDINFSVKTGEIVGLIGRSGAGKSTLIRCLCALERPGAGDIIVNGTNITGLPESGLIKVRRKIGLIFQHFNLLTSRTVEGNISLPLQIAGTPRTEIRKRVKDLIEMVGLGGLEKKYPHQLSGGQKQRVGIARALATNPDVLLSDEATSALDPESTASILKLLSDINKEFGLTILLITHEMEVIKRFAKRILVLDHGNLIQDCTLSQFARNEPDHPALKPLLAEIQPQLPDNLLQKLQPMRQQGCNEAVLRIYLEGKHITDPLFSELAIKFGTQTRLLQGGVSELGEESVCDVIVSITGEKCDEAIQLIAQRAQAYRVLGWLCHP